MKKITYISILTMCIVLTFACKEEKKKGSKKDTFLSSLVGEDYEDKLAIPITDDGKVDTANMAQITYDSNEFNFDTLYVGDRVTHEFTFTNTGIKNLYIMDTSTSCGCTVADYTKEGVQPGEKGTISVTFDSKDRNGKQDKFVTVSSNTYPNETELKMTGFVLKK